MPYNLLLPPRLAKTWRVKIYDAERLEPPHITIVKRRQSWRMDLRRGTFMDEEPPPRAVPKDVLRTIEANWQLLQRQWDLIHPENPVARAEG